MKSGSSGWTNALTHTHTHTHAPEPGSGCSLTPGSRPRGEARAEWAMRRGAARLGTARNGSARRGSDPPVPPRSAVGRAPTDPSLCAQPGSGGCSQRSFPAPSASSTSFGADFPLSPLPSVSHRADPPSCSPSVSPHSSRRLSRSDELSSGAINTAVRER